MDALQQVLHKSNGDYEHALSMAKNIGQYCEKSVSCLQNALSDDHGPNVRGGYLREADDYLDTIIRHAKAVKEALRKAA